MSYENNHKTDNRPYANIISLHEIEWCNLVNGMVAENSFLKSFLVIARDLIAELFIVCSQSGPIAVSNISYAKSALVATFPPGNYKSIYRLYDEIDDNIYNLTSYAIIRK